MTAAVQSMTGAGSVTGACELGTLRIEIRSVNGKAITIRQRVAPECLGLEPAIEAAIRKRFARGTFSVAIDIVESLASGDVAVDASAFARAADRLRDLAAASGLESGPTVRDVLIVPGVLATGQSDRTRTSWKPSAELTALLDGAAAALAERRIAEGQATVAAMGEHLDALVAEVEAVRQRVPQMLAGHRAALLERIGEFMAEHGAALEASDLVREVALFTDRVDISEETQRLDAHVERLRADLAGPGPVGRGVEFLLQEVLREVNTLGSKSPDVEIAHRVVAMKSCVDKLKEQAANLE